MSDSLRDALEKLASERDSVSGHAASDYHIRPYELRELLAAHPAEPAPVCCCFVPPPDTYPDPDCPVHGRPAPVVTDGAVEAALEVLQDHGHTGIKCYDPQAGLDLTARAALEAAAPLLDPRPQAVFVQVQCTDSEELVRPMPTAEQIAMNLSLVRFSDEESDRMIELTMREAWPLADAVLALINGGAK